MNLDSGIAKIWRCTETETPGELPTETWAEVWASYYGEQTVGIQRYYTAKAANDQIDAVIWVQRNRDIYPVRDRVQLIFPSSDRVELDDGPFYRITQVQHVTDEDGLPMTALSLERLEGLDHAGVGTG